MAATSRPGAATCRCDHRRGKGDLSRKITVDVKGEILELKETITPWSISSMPSPRK